jgi:hypothetical protein
MSIPRKQLVGKNATLTDRGYSDDYLTALNEFATVDEVFGPYRKQIADGGNVVGRLVMETLGRSEWENHLVSIVMTAAKAGEWRAVIRQPGRHDEGLDAVTEKRYGFIVQKDGKRFLLPSANYVAYCQAQLDQE